MAPAPQSLTPPRAAWVVSPLTMAPFPPHPAGQGAADAVRVGALPRPGRAQPLRGLAAPGHLSLQHRADPLSAVPQLGSPELGHQAQRHRDTPCSNSRPLGTRLRALPPALPEELQDQLAGGGQRAAAGAWQLETLPPGPAPALLLCPAGVRVPGHLGCTQATQCQEAPGPRDSLHSKVGSGTHCSVARWPRQPSHFRSIFYFNSALPFCA